jgi:Domain of unknown function (DUF1902)
LAYLFWARGARGNNSPLSLDICAAAKVSTGLNQIGDRCDLETSPDRDDQQRSGADTVDFSGKGTPLKHIKVRVAYDEEVGGYSVKESSLPGLRAEAASLEMLRRRLSWVVQDLIAENHLDVPANIPIKIIVVKRHAPPVSGIKRVSSETLLKRERTSNRMFE